MLVFEFCLLLLVFALKLMYQPLAVLVSCVATAISVYSVM